MIKKNNKIVVTGANGFVGKNLCLHLEEEGYTDIEKILSDTSELEMVNKLKEADLVIHLAGVNRTNNEENFKKGNIDFTKKILEILKKNKQSRIFFASSIQAELPNPYGESKREAELLITDYSKETKTQSIIMRYPNLFGKWCKPDYNSVTATFCHNISHSKEIVINDPNKEITLHYIDDLCKELVLIINSNAEGILSPKITYNITLGRLAEMIKSYKDARSSLLIDGVGNGLARSLYATYLSYQDPKDFIYKIKKNEDERGNFSEFMKTKNSGQFSFFTIKPNKTRGNHYHHTKNEKFLIIKGKAQFAFKHLITKEEFSIEVLDNENLAIESIPGWSHNIKNIGEDILYAILWANEIYDIKNPDTIFKPI